MTMAILVADFMMAISGAHPEPRSVILAALAEDMRTARPPHDGGQLHGGEPHGDG